jgi:hypothetical protein
MKVIKEISILIITTIITLSSEQNIECEKEKPSDLTNCSQYDSPGMYGDLCCFYKIYNGSTTDQSKCVSVPYSAYLNYVEYDTLDGILYEVYCNYKNKRYNKAAAVLTKCGEDIKNPSMKKCKGYSSYVDSCCYYNGEVSDNEYGDLFPKDTERGCYWLGAKYRGKISWGGMHLNCASTFLNLERWSFLIFTFTVLNVLF